MTWKRKGDEYPLTVSTFSFLSDGRFVVEHDEDAEWNLLIDSVKMSDTRIYQCRVTTQTMLLMREIHLTVQGKLTGGVVSCYPRILMKTTSAGRQPPVNYQPLSIVD